MTVHDPLGTLTIEIAVRAGRIERAVPGRTARPPIRGTAPIDAA